jgi:hypothetical protein
MREKYVDEKVGVWFIFGEYDNGRVDVSDGQRDVFTHIPRQLADNLCLAHDEFRTTLYALLKDYRP